jgi:TATA-binding protein-associated factor
MSYETLRADVDWAAARPWAYCVLDEGHIIRNPKSKLAQARRHTRPLPGLMFYPLPA